MIDMETMGTEPGAALLSLAAVAFDPQSNGIEDQFCRNIELQSCLDAGLQVSAKTVYWWLGRSEMARSALLQNRVSLIHALDSFNLWLCRVGPSRIWSHGATFDVILLDAAYRTLRMIPPYDFRNARDTRTLFDLAGLEYIKSEETAHLALDDAVRQAEFVQEAYRKLTSGFLS